MKKKRSQIAFDYRPLESSYASRGVGTVVWNILQRLAYSSIAKDVVLFGGENHKPVFSEFTYKKIYRPQCREWIWEQLLWPFDLAFSSCSIFHSTVSLGPLRSMALPLLSPVKTIATIYDLNSLKCADLSPIETRSFFRVQAKALKKVAAILTISDYVKRDIVEYLDVDEHKVFVLPLGVDQRIKSVYDSGMQSGNQNITPYILAMGETANKNIETVIRVFQRVAGLGYNGELRIVGSLDRQVLSVKKLCTSSPFSDRIRFFCDIDTETLVKMYSQCDLFLFPSICEGFGFPVIEALYCRVPVICSRNTGLEEAGGDAVLYRDCGDVEGLAIDCLKVADNKLFKVELSKKGRAHAELKTWDQTERVIVDLYNSLR